MNFRGQHAPRGQSRTLQESHRTEEFGIVIQNFPDILETQKVALQTKFLNTLVMLGLKLLPTEFPSRTEMGIHPLLKSPLSLLASRIPGFTNHDFQ